LAHQPELLAAVNAVGEFDDQTLNELENKVMKLLTTDPKAAIVFYEDTYLPARQQEIKLLKNFLEQAAHLTNRDLAIARTTHLVGLTVAGGVLLCALALGKTQASDIRKNLRQPIEPQPGVSSRLAVSTTPAPPACQSPAEGKSQPEPNEDIRHQVAQTLIAQAATMERTADELLKLVNGGGRDGSS